MSKTFRAEQTREKRRPRKSKTSKRNFTKHLPREVVVELEDKQLLS